LSAVDASLQLQALLGQHAVLAADMMRGRLRGDPDFAQAANAALSRNTGAVGQVVRPVLGAAAEKRFAVLWSAHIAALFNYARGLADGDEEVRRAARATLYRYERGLAGMLAAAAHGRLPRAAADRALRMHVGELLQQADAYAAGDYRRAERLYRAAYSHTFDLGKTLAAALLPPTAAAALDTPQWSLRSELGRLLGEHAALVVAAMRAGVANTKDFAATGTAMNGNTRDLADAVDSLFGAAAAQRFQSQWAEHVEALMAYTAGVVVQDDGQRQAALRELDTYARELADFLATATGNRLAAADLAKAFLMHDQMLVRQVDVFAAHDYTTAHDLAYSAYQQMFDLADQFAAAFGATVTSRMPRGGVQTGGGGTPAGDGGRAGHRDHR
jgi:hypothetical protein